MAVSPTSSSCDSNSCCGVSLLGRAFGVSISIPVLILSVAALAVIPLGWQLGGMLFVGSEAMENEIDENPLRDLVKAKSQTGFISPLKGQYEPQWWWSSQSGWVQEQQEQQEQEGASSLWLGPWNGITRSLAPERGTISGVYTELVEPARKFFDRDAGWNELALYTLGGLWTLLVYALFGGAISRIAVVQLGRGERVSLTDSLRHSIRKLRSYFMAPLFVIIASILLALLIAAPSLLIRASGWGSVAVGVIWVILLILAAAMARMGALAKRQATDNAISWARFSVPDTSSRGVGPNDTMGTPLNSVIRPRTPHSPLANGVINDTTRPFSMSA